MFFIARHVLQAIVNGAPDFFSVRSGVYVFPMSPAERDERAVESLKLGQSEILGLSLSDRNNRIAELEHLLAEVQSIDAEERDTSGEASLRNQLGLAYLSLGQYNKAKPLLVEAVKIRRVVMGADPVDLAMSLTNLAALHSDEG